MQKRGVPNKIESFDGCKYAGISISWAKLNLKISSRYRFEDPSQLFSDMEANSSSLRNLTSTIKIPNEKVDNNIEELTDTLSIIAWKRHELLRMISNRL